jgi:hypothetical protein
MEMDLGEGNFVLRSHGSSEPIRGPREGLEPWPSLLPRSLRSHTGANTKTKPLRKQRSKPHVSEVFGSVSIDL